MGNWGKEELEMERRGKRRGRGRGRCGGGFSFCSGCGWASRWRGRFVDSEHGRDH